MVNLIENKKPALKANIGGHFLYQFYNKTSNVSAHFLLESPTFNLERNVLEKPLDFNYELLFRANNEIADKLGISLLNTKFYAENQIVDAYFVLETLNNKSMN